MLEDFIAIKNIDPNKLIDEFIKDIQPKYKFSNNNGTTHIFIFEYYYFRSSENLSATIIFDIIKNNESNVHIIIAGGPRLKISWGSEKSLMKKTKRYFSKFTNI